MGHGTLGVVLSLSVSLGSQPGDYTAVGVVVGWGAVFMRTLLLCLASPLPREGF